MARSVKTFGSHSGCFYGAEIDPSCEEDSDRAVATRTYVYTETYFPNQKKYAYCRYKISAPGILVEKVEKLDYVPKWFR